MKVCLRCGTTTKDNIDYCPGCGRPVYKEKPVQAPIPEPAPDVVKETLAEPIVEPIVEATTKEGEK